VSTSGFVYRYSKPMAERVTLQTIADRVGVGKMTVSNAYSRPKHLSAELRERIFQVADELGYAGPDASGRALARRRTGLVGVLLTSTPEEAFENLVALGFVSAIARALTPRALSLALLSGHAQDDLVPATDIAMDGLVVYSCLTDDEASRMLMKRRLPMVLVDQPARPGISSVNIEDEDGAAQAARHVVELGHRNVGIVVPWVDAPAGVADFDPRSLADGKLRARLQGWRGTLTAAGVSSTVIGLQRELDHADAATLGTRLLAGPDRPTAILCFSDLIARGVLDAAASVGLAVPRDLTLVGFDDDPLAAAGRTALTTVRQDLDAKGRAAAHALFEAMDAARSGDPVRPTHARLDTELVVRESSAPPPARGAGAR
jgi:DNA-binding LacI/PurR family transcriptional regulator